MHNRIRSIVAAARAATVGAIGASAVIAASACSMQASSPSTSTPATDLVAAGARTLSVAHIVDFADSARVVTRSPAGDTTPRPLGVQAFTEQATTIDGTPAVMLTRHTANSRAQFYDTLLMARAGLVPIWEHMHAGTTMKDIRYTGDRVQTRAFIGDSLARTIDKRFAHAPFGFNQLDLVLRSLPLRQGYRATLPLYSEGDDSVEVDTMSVTGFTPGPNSRWTVRFADPVIISTYGIDTLTRRVTSYEVMNRKSRATIWLAR